MNRKYWEVVAATRLGKWFQITVEREFVEYQGSDRGAEPTGKTHVEISPIAAAARMVH